MSGDTWRWLHDGVMMTTVSPPPPSPHPHTVGQSQSQSGPRCDQINTADTQGHTGWHYQGIINTLTRKTSHHHYHHHQLNTYLLFTRMNKALLILSIILAQISLGDFDARIPYRQSRYQRPSHHPHHPTEHAHAKHRHPTKNSDNRHWHHHPHVQHRHP